MATRSPVFAVTNTAYTKIGDNVTSLSAADSSGETFLIVVVDVGDDAPLVGEANRTTVRGLYQRNSDAVDIYARSTDASGIIQVQL